MHISYNIYTWSLWHQHLATVKWYGKRKSELQLHVPFLYFTPLALSTLTHPHTFSLGMTNSSLTSHSFLAISGSCVAESLVMALQLSLLTWSREEIIKKRRKEKKQNDSAGSDDTASMIKGGDHKFTTQRWRSFWAALAVAMIFSSMIRGLVQLNDCWPWGWESSVLEATLVTMMHFVGAFASVSSNQNELPYALWYI